MSWVSETRERQEASAAERQRRDHVLTELGQLFFAQLKQDMETEIEEINRVYADRFSRSSNSHLVSIESPAKGGIEIRCGVNTVLTANHFEASHTLQVTRYLLTNTLGKFKATTDHYFLKLDHQESLYLESKEGKPIPCTTVPQELLMFLTD